MIAEAERRPSNSASFGLPSTIGAADFEIDKSKHLSLIYQMIQNNSKLSSREYQQKIKT